MSVLRLDSVCLRTLCDEKGVSLKVTRRVSILIYMSRTTVFSVMFAYAMLSLPFGLLGGIPFLDHFYVHDHSVMYMPGTTVLSVMFLARSALMICPGPRRSRLLCLRVGLL